MYCCAWCQHFRNTEKEGSDGYCFVNDTAVRLEDVCEEFEKQEVKGGNKMTNEKWLNTLGTEEKAKFLVRNCNLCIYDCDNNYCSENHCRNGIKAWLEREHIEPKRCSWFYQGGVMEG